MVIVNGWLDWAERLPGPVDKVYSMPNECRGIACHSMEGWGYWGIHGRMMSPERDASGRYTAMAQASWMFSNMADGTFIQHYPVTASTWTSGNWIANTTLWGVESEGKAGTPLTQAQVANMLRLADEFEAYTGRPAIRSGQRTVWQHNEVWNWATPNAGPTACPSNRYDGFFIALEDDMTPAERELFNALVGLFGGRDKILAAHKAGMDYLLGYALEQAEQNQLQEAVARLEAAGDSGLRQQFAHRVRGLSNQLREWADELAA